MNWDPNDWQGRTRQQVERNNRVFGIMVIVGVAAIGIALLLTILI